MYAPDRLIKRESQGKREEKRKKRERTGRDAARKPVIAGMKERQGEGRKFHVFAKYKDMGISGIWTM